MADDNPGVYEPGQNITATTSAAVTSRTFVAVTGNRSSTHGTITVGPATAAGRIAGVAARDTASGRQVTLHRGGGRVTFVTTSAAVTAGQEVEVGTGGTAVPKASGVAVGYALTAAASGADAEISLYY